MKKAYLFLLSALIIAINLSAQKPVFNSVTANGTSIKKYDKFELTIDLTAAYTNPYNYDDISTQCIFTASSGKKDTVDGFYMENYSLDTATGSLTDLNTHNFKVRFTPQETGAWNYVLSATNTSGTTTQSTATFQCTASTAHGFIQKNNTNYLSYSDGTQYIPVGENMGWQDNNQVTDYTKWLGKLSTNGGNFIRVWMSDWAFALEWQNGSNGYEGLEKYKQTNASYLDWLLNKCDSLNVYLMLCLNHHGQVSTMVNPEWSNNPYNAVNGGPCTNTWDFFTNTTARDYYKNRQRYIVARYGYSKNIQSWELFNEVIFTDDYQAHAADVDSWHDEMSTALKALDVNKHLVTSSFGDASYMPGTWNLPNIDFMQLHNYTSVPNLESILTANDHTYLSTYKKPVLNGEFGLGPDGATLTADDPTGVHIHNAIWATALNGAMGTGMTWWWDDYIDPQNLYYHYKPLSSFLNALSLKDDNYKPATSSTSGGGATNLTVSPGTGFSKAPASEFTIDASGKITPDASQLSQYIFGSTYNTQYRNPPTFTVTYPEAGAFKVVVGGISTTSPMVTIKVDNVQILNVAAVANTTYSVDISAGAHTITVDNLGIDWFNVSSYIFTNIGSPTSSYVIKSANNNKAAGWVLNTNYNWQYLKDSGMAPAVISGAKLMVAGMSNGTYTIKFYSCSTGLETTTASVSVTKDTLSVDLPELAWDAAFTAVNESILAVNTLKFFGEMQGHQNILHVEIADSRNVKSIMLERSNDGIHFSALSNLNTTWTSINGKHTYTDAKPLQDNNFYRLKMIDNDGKQTYSDVVLLTGKLVNIKFYPNPFKDYVMLQAGAGKYLLNISDATGKLVYAKKVDVNGSDEKIILPALTSGIYYAEIKDESLRTIYKGKLFKQ